MPKIKDPVTVVIDGTAIQFSKRALVEFPEARAFLTHLTTVGSISLSVAVQYTKMAARLKRQGRLTDSRLLVHPIERTSANAYWKWCAEAYAIRTAPLIHAFADDDFRKGVSWIRRHDLVPPFEGKTITRMTALGTLALDGDTKAVSATPARYEQTPCTTWTLNVVKAPSPAPHQHQDPCGSCVTFEIDAKRGAAIMQAISLAWGHTELEKIPPEALLFGQPPLDSTAGAAAGAASTQTPDRIVALLPAGRFADAVEALGGTVARDGAAFELLVQQRQPDVVVVARGNNNNSAGAALEAVKRAWTAN